MNLLKIWLNGSVMDCLALQSICREEALRIITRDSNLFLLIGAFPRKGKRAFLINLRKLLVIRSCNEKCLNKYYADFFYF